MAKKHSTVTVASDGTIVPWLASSGELAYSPEQPPNRKYQFQFGWHMPNAFKEKRVHYYFGSSSFFDLDTSFIKEFWTSTQAEISKEIFRSNGRRIGDGFMAPIACYEHRSSRDYNCGFVLIQQGSYQLIPFDHQPQIADGKLILYRGIGIAPQFDLFTSDKGTTSPERAQYWQAMEHSFSDSEISFQVAHSFVKRCETGFLADELCWYDIVEKFGLQRDSKLANFHCDSFGMSEHLVRFKFGPNYVKFSTPITNVRLTSFFAGEYEVNVIDPRLLAVEATHGCDIRYRK